MPLTFRIVENPLAIEEVLSQLRRDVPVHLEALLRAGAQDFPLGSIPVGPDCKHRVPVEAAQAPGLVRSFENVLAKRKIICVARR